MPTNPVPKYYHWLTKGALALLRGLYFGVNSLRFVSRPLGRTLGVVFGFLKRWLLLPIYTFIVLFRIRFTRVLGSARGLVFLLVTNRYVFHAVLLIIAVATVSTQLQTKHATASEAGRRSMLYVLVTSGQDQIVEESARPELRAKNTHYLDASTIAELPAIDYDYEDEMIADTSVPGSIAVRPGTQEEQPGIPDVPPVQIRTKTETYIVQSGDTVAAIAARFGVNVGTIVWANGLGAKAKINPGDKLKIPAVSGVLHVVKRGDTVGRIAGLYGVKPEAIYQANELGNVLSVGAEIVVPGGTPPAPAKPKPSIALKPQVPKTAIQNKSYDEFQEVDTTKPDERPKPADEDVTNVPIEKMIWPTVQRRINQYYGWKHTGVDIDGDYTDAIYATADGVVEIAGWNSGGYGLQILIDHQNGMKTRYAHASKMFVAAGDTVKKGQVIAMVGTTGRSTGTHLHFEVYKNSKRQNPLAYVK